MSTSLNEKSRRLAGLVPPREPWSAKDLLSFALGSDVNRGLRAIVGLRHELRLQEERLVRVARSQGWSWGDIGFALRVTRQAAARKWATATKG